MRIHLSLISTLLLPILLGSNFLSTNRFLPKSANIILADVVSLSPFKLSSPDIVEMTAIRNDNNMPTYGYIKSTYKSGGGIFYGYFFNSNSGCFEYGVLYVGNNGVSIFVPCSILNCYFTPICPPRDGAFVRMEFPVE